MLKDEQVAAQLDAARGQTLHVSVYEHRHGADVYTYLTPDGVELSSEAAIALLDEGTFEEDREETMDCFPVLDHEVDALDADLNKTDPRLQAQNFSDMANGPS